MGQLNLPPVKFIWNLRCLMLICVSFYLRLHCRSFKKPVHSAEGLFSRFDQTDVLFSPDDRLVVTCTSQEKGEAGGKVVFYDRDSFKKVFEMTVGDSHCIRAEWHPKINQLLVGSGDGAVKVRASNEGSHNHRGGPY